MSKQIHELDPTLALLQDCFIQKDSVQQQSKISSQQLFHLLSQPNVDETTITKAFYYIKQQLDKTEQRYGSQMDGGYSFEKLKSLKSIKIPSLAERLLTEENVYHCINQSNAILSAQPNCLQNLFQSYSNQSKVVGQLMSIYLKLISKQQKSLLAIKKEAFLAASDEASRQYYEVEKENLDFATLQLSIGLFPRIFFVEILGFTLAFCQAPTLIEVCFPNEALSTERSKRHQRKLHSQWLPLVECINEYFKYFPQQLPSLWKRLQIGFWLYQLQMHKSRDQLDRVFQQACSVEQAVAKLFQQKAFAAIGHHHKVKLQGKFLDKWFAEMPANNQQLLQALRQSHYIDNRSPDKSQLLKLFDFKGPMFGVFDECELEILKNWIKSGSTKISNDSKVTFREQSVNVSSEIEIHLSAKSVRNFSKLSNQQLYYYLLNIDCYPEVSAIAEKKVAKLLHQCRFFNSLPFKHYSHQQFDLYIEQSYQREMRAYQPLQGKPKTSREAYIWGIEQIAPMILIDGCWLQNSLTLKNRYPEISEILFKIYCDELGNGQLMQNHPYIFQQLLKSLSIDVPLVHSKAFTEYSGFIKNAFDLPVYMLALSQFSVKYLPELLGLNMAIELSGLGKGYMQLVDEWNYWGIDPTIAKIHISIDNYASGHTFLAKKSIKLYLDNIYQQTADSKIVDQHWHRIYTGYSSLSQIGWRFKTALPINYVIHKAAKQYFGG